MFTIASPTPYPHPSTSYFPLSPRCANATPVKASLDSKMTRRPGIQSSPLNAHTTLSSRLGEDFSTAQQTFSTPQPPARRRLDPRQQMLQSADEKRGLRRNGFLQKIKGQRDEKRWDARGEQILYDDYRNQRRAWQEEQARTAHAFNSEEPAEDDQDHSMEADSISYQPSRHNTTQLMSEDPTGQEKEEIDELLEAEERELEAMIAMHDAAESTADVMRPRPALLHQQSSPFLGPNDADFEEFMSCPLLTDDAMDTT